MKIYTILLITAVLTLPACAWVKPTEAGAKIIVAESFNVRQCKFISTITTSVKHKIGNMNRKAEKVNRELTALAQNDAAERGADTIVAQGPAREGSMTFDMYRCAE